MFLIGIRMALLEGSLSIVTISIDMAVKNCVNFWNKPDFKLVVLVIAKGFIALADLHFLHLCWKQRSYGSHIFHFNLSYFSFYDIGTGETKFNIITRQQIVKLLMHTAFITEGYYAVKLRN